MSILSTCEVPESILMRQKAYGNLQNNAGISTAEWERIWDPDNSAGRRFYGMGFKLLEGQAGIESETSTMKMLVLKMRFQCICGRTEAFAMRLSVITEVPCGFGINMYHALVRLGALSRGHLLEDGYTPEQIDEMEARAVKASVPFGMKKL